jgi:hypothetical protein
MNDQPLALKGRKKDRKKKEKGPALTDAQKRLADFNIYMQCLDEERSESIALSNNGKRIYMLTEKGVLIVFSAVNLSITFQRPFHRAG